MAQAHCGSEGCLFARTWAGRCAETSLVGAELKRRRSFQLEPRLEGVNGDIIPLGGPGILGRSTQAQTRAWRLFKPAFSSHPTLSMLLILARDDPNMHNPSLPYPHAPPSSSPTTPRGVPLCSPTPQRSGYTPIAAWVCTIQDHDPSLLATGRGQTLSHG